jgi:hypothetical protein
MTLNEYKEKAWSTAMYPNKGSNLIYPLHGLMGECGEIHEKLKKEIRDSKDFSNEECAKEAGDYSWYFNAIVCEKKYSYEKIIGDINIDEVIMVTDRNKNDYANDLFIRTGRLVYMIMLDNKDDFYIRDSLFKCILAWQKFCASIQYAPSHVLDMNIKKLFSRQEREVLHGSGDNR